MKCNSERQNRNINFTKSKPVVESLIATDVLTRHRRNENICIYLPLLLNRRIVQLCTGPPRKLCSQKHFYSVGQKLEEDRMLHVTPCFTNGEY
jgi:hypothetical protein